MKEFHIINVGNSILENFRSSENAKWDITKTPSSEESFWRNLLDNPNFLKEIFNFVKASPRERSAELNSFLRITERKNAKEISVYPFGTQTASNEICKVTLMRFLKENGFNIYTPTEISGYFWEESKYDKDYARSEFEKGISLMYDRIIYLIKKKQEEGFKVFVNPTGGFKTHVIACAMGGFLLGAQVYYIHEEFKELVMLPSLFYLPKGKEIEFLKTLQDKKPRSGKDYEDLEKQYSNEMERLEAYGLIEREYDEFGKYYRVRITNRGILYTKFKKEYYV